MLYPESWLQLSKPPSGCSCGSQCPDPKASPPLFTFSLNAAAVEPLPPAHSREGRQLVLVEPCSCSCGLCVCVCVEGVG